VKGVVAEVIVSFCAVAPSRANSTMVSENIHNTIAKRASELRVEDLGAQALLYHCFEK
jgi:hypothetical protein